MSIINKWVEYLGPFRETYCPEWGCGGIYGMIYYRGSLLFTLAFDAKTIILTRDKVKVYNYELVGPVPRSGGDTYGATLGVDNEIYFGGWVHAPACFDREGRKLIFVKNTHISM